MAYTSEHLPYKRTAKDTAWNIANLSAWWGDKRLAEVTSRNCRAYAQTHTQAVARRDLQSLRAAINYWHREYGPLPSVPAVVIPAKSEPRDQWLTRGEAARLLWAARHTEHLKRFILLALWTGSRSGAILSLTWDRIDFATGVMRRRAYGEAEDSKKRTPPVRLSKRAILFLRRWKNMDGGHARHVIHWEGQAIKKFRHSWRAATERAGVSATPHTLRHTRATWLMQAGVDPWEAAGHLGMSLQTLIRDYAKHSPNFQKTAAEV